jgi:SAM-dependent methyltransferase
LVWHHVSDWQEATNEAARVLRPGGLFVLADLLDPAFSGPIRRLFRPHGTYRLDEVNKAIREAGFRRLKLGATRGWYRMVATV